MTALSPAAVPLTSDASVLANPLQITGDQGGADGAGGGNGGGGKLGTGGDGGGGDGEGGGGGGVGGGGGGGLGGRIKKDTAPGVDTEFKLVPPLK